MNEVAKNELLNGRPFVSIGSTNPIQRLVSLSWSTLAMIRVASSDIEMIHCAL